MKRLIILPLLLICLASFGQRIKVDKTFTVPAGADSTFADRWYSYDNSWSVDVNSTNVTGADTLYVYCSTNLDTTSYSLIWVDQDLDGINDNPWTLSITENLLLWGESWPCEWIIYRLAKGNGVAGEIHYYTLTKK